jgi:hypothetical protein
VSGGRRVTIPSPEINFSFYAQSGAIRGGNTSPLFEEFVSVPEAIRAEHEQVINEYGRQKSEIFLEQENSARSYWQELGFANLPEVYVVDDDPDDVLVVRDLPLTIAQVDAYLGHVIVRQSRLDDTNMEQDPIMLGSMLVHEFGHATSGSVTDISVQEHDDREWDLHMRLGFMMDTPGGQRGGLFEEMFGAYHASRYHRHMHGDDRAIGIEGTPTVELPEYMLPPDPAMTAGPDGYIAELLAYGLEQKNILSAEDFFELLLETRRTDDRQARTLALRAFAQSVDSLESGLYTMLHRQQRSKQGWIDASRYVHGVVTAQDRQVA